MKALLVLSILISSNAFAAIQSDESKAKACLNAASLLQGVFHNNHGYYASDVNRLDWGTDECLATFNFSIKSEKAAYVIEVKNKATAWKIDHKQKISKL